tara:strand:+ start:1006 stop:1575 length:570 start_codon:yes stop_codon:yes gene_type:complete
MSLITQPDNINLLSPVGFRFGVKKLPTVNWFVQAAELPGLTLGETLQTLPTIDRPLPGDTLVYDPFTLNFKVDEDFANWMELQKWMVGVGFPEDTDQFRTHVGDPVVNTDGPVQRQPTRRGQITDALVSDATLLILNSNMNANFEVTFIDLFPTSLSALNFDTTLTDVDYITATATFRYLRYDYKKIST